MTDTDSRLIQPRRDRLDELIDEALKAIHTDLSDLEQLARMPPR